MATLRRLRAEEKTIPAWNLRIFWSVCTNHCSNWCESGRCRKCSCSETAFGISIHIICKQRFVWCGEGIFANIEKGIWNRLRMWKVPYVSHRIQIRVTDRPASLWMHFLTKVHAECQYWTIGSSPTIICRNGNETLQIHCQDCSLDKLKNYQNRSKWKTMCTLLRKQLLR